MLHNLILEMYLHADVVISYQVPTCWVKPGWVAPGYWKGGAYLYTNNPDHIAEFKAKHPKFMTGKASINFNVGEDIPLDDLKQVFRHAIERQS